MKKFLYFFICMLMLCACNKTQPVEDTQAPDENVQEQAMDKAKGDSTKNENKLGSLEVKITNIQTDVNNLKVQQSKDSTSVEELSKNVDQKVDSSIVYVMIGGFALLLILIIISLFKISDLRSKTRNSCDILTQKINSNKQQQNYAPSNVGTSYARKGDIVGLQDEIEALKKRVRTLENAPVTVSEPVKAKDEKKHNTSSRFIYFGKNSGKIFSKELPPSNELVVFKGELISSSEVKFQPVSLDRIRSLNDIESVVTIKGSIQNARTMKVDKFGRAAKEQGYWKVESPVIIYVS